MFFFQLDDESILDVWKRYKVLLNKVSNHRLPPWLEIQFFYNRLHLNIKMIIDIIPDGTLMSKNLVEAQELLDEMHQITINGNHQEDQQRRSQEYIN